MEANAVRTARKGFGEGNLSMMTVEQVQKRTDVYSALDQKKALDVASGTAVALLSSVVPFMLSYALTHASGLTAFNYPAVQPVAAAAGLAICILSLPIAMDMKSRSVQGIAASSAVIFWILGLLASFTV